MSKETTTNKTNEVLDIDLELFDEENEYQVKGKVFGNKTMVKAKKEVLKGIAKLIKEAIK